MNGWQSLGFKSYQEYLQSDLWKEKKKSFLIDLMLLDREICCSRCKRRKNLNLHHKSYKNVGQEKKEDLELLCFNCHKKEHKVIENE